jgi:uncharacterized protein with HEPN domain
MADERDAMLTIVNAYTAIRKAVGLRSYADLRLEDEAYRSTLNGLLAIAAAARDLSAETKMRYRNVDWTLVSRIKDGAMDARLWDLATKQLLPLKDAALNEIARMDSR